MGKIPAVTNMVGAIITNPKVGVQVPADTTFNIEVQTKHLSAGFFTNPTTNYYTAPQDLDKNGDIIGHCHVTVQDIGSLQSNQVPDTSSSPSSRASMMPATDRVCSRPPSRTASLLASTEYVP
jgi:transcription initiation factor TFIID subunit 15